MSNSIGRKITFWTLVRDGITIPTLQRDYVYGAGTEKTEVVLGNMLDTFKKAFELGHEETLDFVYGSESKAKEFMPLDGQQRLTTLYLLHYYAALIANHPDGFTDEDDDKIFATLNKFSYATRNCTITFCTQLLIAKYKLVRKVVLNSDIDVDSVISDYLKDMDDFRGSFYTDPSVMSMLVVLDRIHNKFRGMDFLWERLTADDCPINFYQLDFGVFDLSDDLYSKMNSRGKPLTSFEIFKAKMHKHIKTRNKKNADDIAMKLDTTWMQYIWEILEYTQELKNVDPAYMCFLKNLFKFFDYISGCEKQQFDRLDDNCLRSNMSSTWRVKAMENVFDTLASKSKYIPEAIREDYNGFIRECVKVDMHNNRMLLLYAIFLGLYYSLDESEFVYRYRHVRNVVNNSGDIIREEFMNLLLLDISHIMQGKLCKIAAPKKLNSNSWAEEQEKERHREIWSKLFDYEDIWEINGTLNAFAVGLNDNNTLDLGNSDFVNNLQTRLEKAAHFFNETSIEEHKRRSALLSLGSYAIAKYKNPQYRYFGVIRGSWQNFTGYHRYDECQNIMDVIDKIDTSRSISSYVGNTENVAAENWRYYAIKYATEITVSYRKPDYGYMYFFGIDEQNPYNDKTGYIDVVILQSSYYSSSNVAWKMIHRLLELRCSSKYHMFLYHIGGDQILLSKICKDAKMDIQPDGWHLIGINHSELDKAEIQYTIITNHQDEALDEEGNVVTPLQLSDCLVSHKIGEDYVEEGETILKKLSSIYTSLVK
jgi:hypothetical protein